MTDVAGTTVTFWFDPLCPATWATSQWLRDVAPQRGIEIDWQVMSLAILNEEREKSEQQRKAVARMWRPIRVLAAAGETHGASAKGRLYRAFGVERHDRRRSVDDELLTDALSAAVCPSKWWVPPTTHNGMTSFGSAIARASNASAWTAGARSSPSVRETRSSGRSSRRSPPATAPWTCGKPSRQRAESPS